MIFKVAGQYVVKNPFRNEVAVIKIDELTDYNNFDSKVEILKTAEKRAFDKLGFKRNK